jgi:hypothetical protein
MYPHLSFLRFPFSGAGASVNEVRVSGNNNRSQSTAEFGIELDVMFQFACTHTTRGQSSSIVSWPLVPLRDRRRPSMPF